MLGDAKDFFNVGLDQNQPFKPLCGFTWERYSAFFNKLSSEEEHSVTILFEFLEGIVCFNSHFNKDTDDIDPANQFKLISKWKKSKLWLMKPDATSMNSEEKERNYQLVGSVYWEMEILNKDNMSHSRKPKNECSR